VPYQRPSTIVAAASTSSRAPNHASLHTSCTPGACHASSDLGRLERVDPATGHRDDVAVLPGYARGLAFHGDLAFVGLSRIRETAIFGGVPIAAYHEQLKCGVGVIELSTGNTVATLQFANGVEEIFDVQSVPGARCPTFGDSPDGNEVWVLPGQRVSTPASSSRSP
jgi:hypothetical protein